MCEAVDLTCTIKLILISWTQIDYNNYAMENVLIVNGKEQPTLYMQTLGECLVAWHALV